MWKGIKDPFFVDTLYIDTEWYIMIQIQIDTENDNRVIQSDSILTRWSEWSSNVC